MFLLFQSNICENCVSFNNNKNKVQQWWIAVFTVTLFQIKLLQSEEI